MPPPLFLGPWLFPYIQSHISGDVIFDLKNSFLTIKNKKWGVLLRLLPNLYLCKINPRYLTAMMPEILANNLFRLLGFRSQCLCIGLLCVAVAKSVPGDGRVSFLLIGFYELVTVLDHKLLSVMAHLILQRFDLHLHTVLFAAGNQIITGL